MLSLLLVSCSEYTKLQKSTDNNLKFEKAKEYYGKEKYLQAATLLEQVLPVFKGTEKGEEALFLLGMSYFKNKDYLTARSYFASYYRSYPKGKYAEESKFNVGYCYYKDSPNPKFDQASTTKALEELFLFSELFPQSKRLSEVLEMVKELQEKLAYKAYLNANLYYKLGNYKGNNYQSAVIAATNAIKEYPNSNRVNSIYFALGNFEYTQKRYKEAIDYYEKTGQSITGMTYLKNHFGPTPAPSFAEIVKKMSTSGDLEVVKTKYFSYDQKKYLPLKKPNLETLSAKELDHINWEIDRLSDKTAKELSEFSHYDAPWAAADPGKPIDYQFVFYRGAAHAVTEPEDEL